MAIAQQSERTWSDLCDDPALQDLPYKIETNERGQLIMSPSKYWHGTMQAKLVASLAKQMTSGELSVETAIRTSRGVKVADVAWASDTFLKAHAKEEPELQAAPDLCVEVKSESNTEPELAKKRSLYFAVGAKEVWTCDRNGHLRFYEAPGTEIPASTLFPKAASNLDGAAGG